MSASPTPKPSRIDSAVIEAAGRELLLKHGEGERARIERGIEQVASLWRPQDGDAEAFLEFLRAHFVAGAKELDVLFERCQRALEALDGHLNEVSRELRWWTDVDLGPLLPVDELLAAHDPFAHVVEDLFQGKFAFLVLANFKVTALAERLRDGPSWTRRQWAEARLAQRFSKRLPAAVSQQITRAVAAGESYVAQYNIWLHHALDGEGKRLFPKGLRLISHWNLRDELKANYADPLGLAKQRLIAQVMERIVTQTIPRAVIDNPRADWCPYTNEVRPAPPESIEPNAPAGQPAAPLDGAREPDRRYAHLLATFEAARQADPYSPGAPTLIVRRFEEDRELPEERVRGMLEAVLASPLAPKVAALIEKRLGRKLESFDIWYGGFLPRSRHPEAELDALTRKRYPTAEAFTTDMPALLVKLGFEPQRARYLAEHIAVDPARGAGHAMPALRRGDKPRLRTRVGQEGMNYKGFNIAIHELGHNVEQVFSLYDVDQTLLAGVPNNAFTEALAFVFQARDLELLGLARADPEGERWRVLNEFWMTYEISGPALVDMTVWHWLYDHPAATPEALREATLQIARDVWNRFYAPVLGVRDSVLLAIYSHMIHLLMYLPDYPIGHLIAFQIEERVKRGKSLGEEFERMARFGRVTPDLWMEHATGAPVSAEPLLSATAAALRAVGE